MTRTVVVTGGGTGIGKAVAATFCRWGDTVVITGRRLSVLRAAKKELGRHAICARVDATNPQEVQAFADEVRSLDVLVNNAGLNCGLTAPSPAKSLVALAECWQSNLEANVLPPVLMTAACLEKMQPGGSIITIGSIAAEKGFGAYGAAKAAIASWNVDLAREVGRRGLTANVVAPGYVDDTDFFGDQLRAEVRASWIATTLTGSAATPADVAATVEFLASPGARQITGQVVAVNGGASTSR
ncbi:SDR family NAD(P)-dependent oxidoreductase [Mycobacterium haemophilum]